MADCSAARMLPRLTETRCAFADCPGPYHCELLSTTIRAQYVSSRRLSSTRWASVNLDQPNARMVSRKRNRDSPSTVLRVTIDLATSPARSSITCSRVAAGVRVSSSLSWFLSCGSSAPFPAPGASSAQTATTISRSKLSANTDARHHRRCSLGEHRSKLQSIVACRLW